MTDAPAGWGSPRWAVVGVLLLVVALVFGALHLVVGRGEQHAYIPGAQAPADFALTVGHQYEIATHGGLAQLDHAGLANTPAQCGWSARGSGPAALSVALLGSDDRSLHSIGTFVAPATGRIAIACTGWGAVFVDDADDARPDWSGVFLLLALISAVAGVAVTLGSLYRGAASGMLATVGA